MLHRTEHAGFGKVWRRTILPILGLLATVAPVAAQRQPFSEVTRAEHAVGPRAMPGGEWKQLSIDPVLSTDHGTNAEEPKRSLVDAVRYTETPFVQQYSFPVSELWRGHLEVDGFSSNYSMENLLWGLPASGNLPSWGVNTQSHVAVSAPNQAGTFGFALSLHIAASENDNAYFRPREWISRLVHSSRG